MAKAPILKIGHMLTNSRGQAICACGEVFNHDSVWCGINDRLEHDKCHEERCLKTKELTQVKLVSE